MSAPRFTGSFDQEGVLPYRIGARLLVVSSLLVLGVGLGRDSASASAAAAFFFYAATAVMTLVGLFGPKVSTRISAVVDDERLLLIKDRDRQQHRAHPRKYVAASAEASAVGARVTLYDSDSAETRLLGDVESVAALLAALELPSETTQARASQTETIRPPLAAFLVALLVPFAVIQTRADSSTAIHLLLAGFVSLGLPLAAICVHWWSRVTVGSDGVELKTLFSRRFIRIEELHAVERESERVVLVLQSGERVYAMRAATLRKPGPQHVDEAALVERRIQDALRHHEERTRVHANVAQVSRGARSASEWVAALRALGAGNTAYRDGAASPDALASMIEDPTASDDVRIGAAVALRVSGDPVAVQHIRVAAAATAEPELRGALEGVLEEAEATLEARVEKMRILSRSPAERTR